MLILGIFLGNNAWIICLKLPEKNNAHSLNVKQSDPNPKVTGSNLGLWQTANKPTNQLIKLQTDMGVCVTSMREVNPLKYHCTIRHEIWKLQQCTMVLLWPWHYRPVSAYHRHISSGDCIIKQHTKFKQEHKTVNCSVHCMAPLLKQCLQHIIADCSGGAMSDLWNTFLKSW